MAQTVYPDLQIREGDQLVTYSKEGLKVMRKFFVTSADQSDPTGTLYAILVSGAAVPTGFDLPLRGSPHPSINITNAWSTYMTFDTALCADIITIKAVTSSQAVVEVEYQVFNAVLQEVSDPDGTVSDQAPALLTIASSVQQSQTQQDAAGNIIQIPYSSRASGPDGGPQYNISPYQGAKPIDVLAPTPGPPFSPGSPSYKITAPMQVPNTIYRFQRRESIARNPDGFVGLVNSTQWTINNAIYDPFQILCTRIESVTEDNGLSWIVTYEFQVGVLSPTPDEAQFVEPAAESATNMVSPWLVASYYTLPNGYYAKLKTPNASPSAPKVIQQGAIPYDAQPWFFQPYDQIDFNAALSLN